MEPNYSKNFLKNYRRGIEKNKNLDHKFKDRLQLFLCDPGNPLLKDHKLVGAKKHLRAFSITGDIRVIYFLKGNVVNLVDIGTHNQVY